MLCRSIVCGVIKIFEIQLHKIGVCILDPDESIHHERDFGFGLFYFCLEPGMDLHSFSKRHFPFSTVIFDEKAQLISLWQLPFLTSIDQEFLQAFIPTQLVSPTDMGPAV